MERLAAALNNYRNVRGRAPYGPKFAVDELAPGVVVNDGNYDQYRLVMAVRRYTRGGGVYSVLYLKLNVGGNASCVTEKRRAELYWSVGQHLRLVNFEEHVPLLRLARELVDGVPEGEQRVRKYEVVGYPY